MTKCKNSNILIAYLSNIVKVNITSPNGDSVTYDVYFGTPNLLSKVVDNQSQYVILDT